MAFDWPATAGNEHALRILPGIAGNVHRIGEQRPTADEHRPRRYKRDEFMAVYRHLIRGMTGPAVFQEVASEPMEFAYSGYVARGLAIVAAIQVSAPGTG